MVSVIRALWKVPSSDVRMSPPQPDVAGPEEPSSEQHSSK